MMLVGGADDGGYEPRALLHELANPNVSSGNWTLDHIVHHERRRKRQDAASRAEKGLADRGFGGHQPHRMPEHGTTRYPSGGRDSNRGLTGCQASAALAWQIEQAES